jgi:hypothetical protein
MSFGKSGGTTVTTPELTPEQRQQIQAQNEFFTGTIAPTYEQAVTGATNLYESGAPGVTTAAQNLAGVARQGQATLGETGESALRTGITDCKACFHQITNANSSQLPWLRVNNNICRIWLHNRPVLAALATWGRLVRLWHKHSWHNRPWLDNNRLLLVCCVTLLLNEPVLPQI